MSLNHLVFDASDAQSILDSANVGAFVRANDGTLITKHDKGLAFASVVYDTVTFTADFAGTAGNSIALVFDGIQDVATVVGAWNTANPSNTVSYSGLGTYVPTAGTATLVGGTDSHGLDIWMLNPSMVVTANNLDIRDLAAATDSISSWTKDGSGNAISSTGGALDVNIKTPLVLDVKLDGVYTLSNLLADSVGNIFNTRAVTPDITGQVERVSAALLGTVLAADVSKVHALDVNAFLSAKNGTNGNLQQLTIDNTNGGLDVNVKNTISVSDVALADSAIKAKAETLAVANTAQAVFSAPLAARKYVRIFNEGNKAIYIGDATVTATDGYPIFPGAEVELRCGPSVTVDFVGQTGISGATSAKIRTLQLS